MNILVFVSDDDAFLKCTNAWRNAEKHLFGVIPTRSIDVVKNQFDQSISENTLVRKMFDSKKQSNAQYIDSFPDEYRVFCLVLDRVSFYCTSSMFAENLFGVFVEAALDFLMENKLQKVVFGNVPHQVHAVAFQVAAKILNLDAYHREIPAIGSGIITLWFKNGNRIEALKSTKISESVNQKTKLEVIVESIKKIEHGSSSTSRFDYMIGQTSSRNLAGWKYKLYSLKFLSFIPWLSLVLRNNDGFFNTPHISQFASFDPYPSIFTIRKIFLQKKRVIDSFLKEYKGLSSDISDNLDYIYFPLHYQPEASTVPLGWPFHDQIYVAHKIADNLPHGFMLIVKEHPTQFHLNFRGDRGRWKGYYQSIYSHPKILLAHINTNSDEIIKGSKGVVSVNGSTVLESGIKFEKNSVVLANDTYHNLHRIRYSDSIESAVDLLLRTNKKKSELNTHNFSKENLNKFFVGEVPNLDE